MRYFNNLRVILVLLVLTLCGVDQVWAANGVALPAPVVGWNCALPPEAKFGDVINYDSETFTGLGSDVALNQFRFLPSLVHPAFAAQCRVRWSQGEGGEDAVACVMRDVSAESSAVLQCGNGGGTLNGATQCTLYMKFRLVLPMSTGGGGPVPQELDGYLLQLASNLTLMVSGRGKTGREKHRPTLVISGTLPNATQRYESRYQPQLDDELQIGPWYRLVLTWDGSQPEDFKSQPGDTKRVRLWLNGKEYPMKRTGTLTASPAILQVNGPVLVGGNRQRNNAPLDLAGFAIYNSALADGQVALLNTQGLGKHVAGKKTVVSPPAYERIPAGNHPEGWRDAPAAFSFTTVNDDMLKITFADVAKDAVNACYLKQPLALDTGVATVNYWACFPADSTCGIALTPLFTDAKGKEIAGTSNGFFSHIAPPNSRKGGQWRYFTIAVPRKEGAVTFVGYSLKVTNTPQGKASGTLYVKDLGLDRINYAQAQLYYVVGNYRDNFSMPEFNGSGARALADQSAGSVVPYLLLDNVVDQAKRGRPLQLNLQLSAYDTQDRLVYASTVSNLPAQGVPDFFRQLPIPLTKPGTYRIKGKSYNAATGEYFTTDWVKLIIVKGSAKPVTTVPETGLLAINPAKPYGRLEKTDKAEITFSVGRLPNAGACELRYTVIPYELWVPVFQAVRPVTCEQKVLVTKPGNITVPYTPHRTVELVVAELWQGGKRLEHEERPIGIRNELDKAPAFVTRANIPSLDDQAGPGKQWINTHFTDDLGQDPKQHMARNIDEAKQHSANIGFRVDMNRLEPIPGVYDWDYLTPMFDMAAEKGCRMIPYLNLKWPVDWAPVEFQVDADGTVHRVGTLWGYMVGKYLYPNGEYAPQIIKQFCTQFARQYLNHPGLGGYYFENEHIDTTWANGVIDSHHEAARQHFAQYLAKRYGAIARLNAAYGRAYATFANVALPGKDADSPKALLADYNRFMYEGAQRFILDNEFDPVRQEDPQRPIIVYMFGSMSDAFLQHVAANGGILANGGVHSNFDADIWYDRYTAVPGLRCRMEPHGMWSYNPIPNGFDEMIFGMLAMGGRGLAMQVFLSGATPFKYDAATQPGHSTGLDKVVTYAPMMRELSDADKQHDAVGILELRQGREIGAGYEDPIRPMHCAIYAFAHYNPRVVSSGGRPDSLDGVKVIFAGGSVIDAEQSAFLLRFVQRGGTLVMPVSAGQYRLESPDAVTTHALLSNLGIDFFAAGTQRPDMPFPHDCYQVGNGQVLILRTALNLAQWETILPAVMRWTGVTTRLADTDDRYMQLHVLRRGGTWYLATTHRGSGGMMYTGPKTWTGKVRFLQQLPTGNYRVTEMMNSTEVGTFTPAQLADGFAAGEYNDLQMKIFKIEPIK